MNVPSFDDLAVGDALPPLTHTFTRAKLVRYAGASGDFNPIHWNQRIATEVGLPDVIAHGMFTMAVAGRLVTDWAGPAAMREFLVTFTRPVPVPDDEAGATVEFTGTIGALDPQARTARIDLKAVQVGAKAVLGKAQAVVQLADG